MLFETHTPDNSIAPFIESIFYFKDFMPEHSIERVIPTGHLFILMELDGFPRLTYQSDTLEPKGEFSKVWISGIHSKHLSISAHEHSEMFVIQFKAFGSFPFTHIPVVEFNEQVIPHSKIFDPKLICLRENIHKAETSLEKFNLAEEWLLTRFDAKKAPPDELVNFILKLQNEPIVKLNELIHDYPTTHKNLLSQFKKYVGMTPKVYQRILRFNGLLAKIRNKELLSWSNVAYECGYSDQAHFIREFQTFSGKKPEEFIGEGFNKLEPNFFPIK